MANWHWYDTVICIACWSLPAMCFGAKVYLDWRWYRKFGERKPR